MIDCYCWALLNRIRFRALANWPHVCFRREVYSLKQPVQSRKKIRFQWQLTALAIWILAFIDATTFSEMFFDPGSMHVLSLEIQQYLRTLGHVHIKYDTMGPA